MKKAIEVSGKAEGSAIEEGLKDPVLRAIVTVQGVLNQVNREVDASAVRVIAYVAGEWGVAAEKKAKAAGETA